MSQQKEFWIFINKNLDDEGKFKEVGLYGSITALSQNHEVIINDKKLNSRSIRRKAQSKHFENKDYLIVKKEYLTSRKKIILKKNKILNK